VFAERLPGIAKAYSRRTDRLGVIVRLVGYHIGGLPGSRVLERLAVKVSDDTILRATKNAEPCGEETDPIRHLGIDDWAWRKGQRYGTILVDLERRRVADLLPDRSADDLAAWLGQHPTVQTISRDRCGTYADAANRGAPFALQVADRFHLVLNLSAAMERVLESQRRNLELAPLSVPPIESDTLGETVDAHETAAQRHSAERRQRRLARYEQVVALHARGQTQTAISRAVGISLKTVRRWLRSGQFPERKPVINRHSHVREFADYLRRRWADGCHNSTQLFREIRGRGYRGSRQMVSYLVSAWRAQTKASQQKASGRLAPRQAAVLLCKREADRSPSEESMFEQLIRVPMFATMHAIAVDFRDALQRHDGQWLRWWVRDTIQCGIGPLVRFACGLHRDLPAVVAAADTDWSNGQVEGQINRLRTLKRQMYGRAGFALLRARVLPYIPAANPP